MKKHILRREFIKLRIAGKTNKECQKLLGIDCDRRTLRRWWKRFNEEDNWNLTDTSKAPSKLQTKFSEEERKVIERIRKNFGYGPKKTRIQAHNEGVDMSISTVKRIIKQTGLSKGSPMEGTKLRWVRFERENPNSMWQIDGDENDDGTWRVPVVDDCSRYCLGVYEIEHNTTKATIKILENCIKKHGKPREILTDNGPEFG